MASHGGGVAAGCASPAPACILQNPRDTHPRDPLEVPQVARDQLQIVVQRRRRDLEIRVRQDLAGRLQFRAEAAVHTRRRHVVLQNGHCGQDPLLDVAQVALPLALDRYAALNSSPTVTALVYWSSRGTVRSHST